MREIKQLREKTELEMQSLREKSDSSSKDSDDSGDSGGVHKGSLKILEVSYGIVVFFFCQGVT